MDSIFKLLARVDGKFVPVRIQKDKKKEIPIAVPGASSYYVRYTENGKRVVESLGKDFNHAVVEWRNTIVRGTAKANDIELPKGIAPDARLTLLEAKEKYFAKRPHLSAKSVQTYKRSIDRFISSCHTNFINDVDEDDLIEFIKWLKERPVKLRIHANPERTIHNHLGHVRIFLKAFGKEKLIKDNQVPEYFEKEVKAHEDEELDFLYHHADPEMKFILDFYIGSMARASEGYTCRYEQVSGTSLTLYGKRHKTRTVEIGPALAAAIRERRKKSTSDLIFPNRKNKPKTHLLRDLQTFAKKAGAKFHTELHKLRKTGASQRLYHGATLKQLMLWLGHESLEVTAVYLANVRTKEMKEAVAKAEYVAKPYIVRTGTDGDWA